MKRFPWLCRNCGPKPDPEEPSTDPQTTEPKPTPPGIKPKSGAVTILLAVLLCGAGHVYAGRVRRGLILLGISVAIVAAVSVMGLSAELAVFYVDDDFETLDNFILVSLAPVVGGLAFYAWTIYDAWKVHSRYNAVLAKTGVPPWELMTVATNAGSKDTTKPVPLTAARAVNASTGEVFPTARLNLELATARPCSWNDGAVAAKSGHDIKAATQKRSPYRMAVWLTVRVRQA